ncbi:MAG: hypothetical protein L3J16_03140 [Anaerolineales bacterium]|nr:hypothetical protein [Anaerolineales bacterium]
MKKIIIIILFATLLISAVPYQAPNQPVKLIFIHHSTGENWLTDGYGNLGRTLGENNYFVSDTNYGWGPDSIGDRTDIPDWVEWFASDQTPTYMNALFNEFGQNADYTRNLSDPGGENVIIMFKSCFPNSDLYGNPNDPPGDYEELTVAGAKYVYNEILQYFESRPDKLFIAITAPPLSDPTNAANARAFNDWLVNEWLADYGGNNVAVFDFYDVLTAHGASGDTLNYPSDDDHPSEEGSRIATAEFLPELNAAYNRWQAGDTSAPPADDEPAPAEEASPVPELDSAPPSASDLIDNFEGDAPLGSYGWEAFKDDESSTKITCAPSDETAKEGQRSLKIEYDVEIYSWATCNLSFENAQNWREYEGVSFSVHAAQSDTFFNVDLFVDSPTGEENYVAHLRLDSGADGWQEIFIPWTDFKRVDWEENGGSPFTKPEQIGALAFGFETPDHTEEIASGVIYIDELSLGRRGDEALAPQPVEAPPEESPAEEGEPSGSPLPCVGGLLFPLGLVGLAFRRKWIS